ncbi:MAG: hypothetical protein ACI8WW_000361, partial [Oceanospirillaceae bacterium]
DYITFEQEPLEEMEYYPSEVGNTVPTIHLKKPPN